jgi:hypothetical protein
MSRSAALGPGLPTTWCGSEQAVDDKTDATQSALTPVVKVVYAHASDQADRFDTWASALQGNVATIGRFLAEQSSGGRAVTFDMGTSCGAQYLDVTAVHLSGPATAYQGDVHFTDLRDAVLSALGPATAPRNVLIMADQLGTDSTYGLGQLLPSEDTPGSSNAHNRGGLAAAIYSVPGSTPGATGWQPTMMLHEITHNLGAVQRSAPHSTPNGHCWDGRDVMCYSDGSTGSQPYTSAICGATAGDIPDVYDCGHDDYYDPAAPAGSYLDTHWNVYRSVFMAPCTGLGLACSGLTRALAPPISATPPVLVGTTFIGQVLKSTAGTWQNSPTSTAIVWQQEIATDIWRDAGEGSDFTLTPADLGTRLRTLVTASNSDGSASVTSAVSEPIVATPAEYHPPSVAARTPLVVAPVTRVVAAAQKLRVVLRRRGRVVATLVATVASGREGLEVRTAAARAKAGAGRWRLKLCATAAGHPRRCVLGPRARSARGAVRLAAARVLPGVVTGRVTVTAALVDVHARTVARGSAASR